MADYRTNEIITGLFIVAAICVFSLFAFKVGGFDLFGILRGETQTLKTHFTDVKGLQSGAPVKVGGQVVGKVKSVQLRTVVLSRKQSEYLSQIRGRATLEVDMMRPVVEVTFEVSATDLKIDPETAQVMLSQDSLLAPHFLDLDPGHWKAGEAPPQIGDPSMTGSVLAAREGDHLGRIMANIEPTVLRIDRTLARINERFLSDRNSAQIHQLLERLNSAVEGIRKVSRRLDSMLDPESNSPVQAILGDIEEVAGGLEGRLDRLQASVDGFASRTTESLQSFLAGARADFRSALDSASRIAVDNRAGLAESVRRLRRTMWQLEMASRQVNANPAVVFWGSENKDFEAVSTDDLQLRISGRARPFRQRDEASE